MHPYDWDSTEITAFAFDHEGEKLAYGSRDGVLSVTYTSPGSRSFCTKLEDAAINRLRFDDSGRYLLCTRESPPRHGGRPGVHVIDLHSKAQIWQATIEGSLTTAGFIHDARSDSTYVATMVGFTIQIRGAQSGAPVPYVNDWNDSTPSGFWPIDYGRSISVFCDRQKALRRFDMATGRYGESVPLETDLSMTHGGVVSETMAAAQVENIHRNERYVNVWDSKTGKSLMAVPCGLVFDRIALSRHRKIVAFYNDRTRSQTVEVWDAEKRKRIAAYAAKHNPAFALNANGTYLAMPHAECGAQPQTFDLLK